MLIECCPNCGGSLTRVTLGGAHAPWLCSSCRLGFWDAELDSEHRARWRGTHRDFGRGPHTRVIRAAVAAERAARVAP